MTTGTDDYERLPGDCVGLFEDLETAMCHIDLLMRDLTWTATDIRTAIGNIKRRINECETRLEQPGSQGR